jgi:hypothetical protein
MAYLIFSGDAAVFVEGTATEVTRALSNGMVIVANFVLMRSEDHLIHVNPRQVAYVVDNEAYESRRTD